MKTPLGVALLLAWGLLATQAEPEKAKTTSTNAELAVAKLPVANTSSTNSLAGLKEQKLQNQGGGAVPEQSLTKAPPSKARSFLELFNPFAPTAPQPQSRWIERSAWGTTASRAGSMTPVEVRHEAQFGIVAAGR